MSRLLTILILLSLIFLPFPASPTPTQAATTELFFSEYIEGNSNNKALEIYNDTGASIDLSAGQYSIQMFFNSNPSAGLTIALTGSVADGDVFVLAHAAANAPILAQADQTNSSGWYNGNDTVVLRKNGVFIDAIGQIAANPLTEWGSGLVSTADNTLRRKSTICQGDPNATDAFDPATEWDGYPTDTFAGLGAHTATCPDFAGLLINEVDADQVGTDTAEFIELFDGGAGNTALTGYSLVLFNGGDDLSYAAFDLDGLSTNANGYFVLCGDMASVPGCDMDVSPDADLLQNGPDAVALYSGDAASFPDGSPITTTNLVDALVYDTGDADDAGLLALLNTYQPQVNENDRGDATAQSNQRCPNGSGGARNTVSYSQYSPNSGALNTCGAAGPFGDCGDPATPINTIQGSGLSSLYEGDYMVVEGIIVGDFQSSVTGLGGFFVQEEDTQTDANPLTSEGIFVYTSTVPVNMGDLVRVQGRVVEYAGLTELSAVNNLAVCSTGNPIPTAAIITLPLASGADWERWEGMEVIFSQAMFVTENYFLGRYGELDLSVDARLDQPTDVVAPGAPALALQALNNRSRIQLDDGSNVQNPAPLPPYLAADNTLRIGDSVSSLAGVLSYSYSSYEIHPTGAAVTFTRQNQRTPAPPPLVGELKIAGMNTLNFFTTLTSSGSICGPSANLECRGADNPAEFTRQREKLLAAMSAINADIFGLVELENNTDASAQSLVDGLNALLGAGTYTYIDTGTIGTDAIKVALLYKPARVWPVGTYSILDSSDDPNFLDTKNRPSLAQTFQDANGEKFTVVVDHFKSKGSPCTDVGDPDANDGQGDCNLTRTRAATALAGWLATDPTHSCDPDFLLLGDFNAYSMEDPVTTLKNAGYTNLVDAFLGAGAYSYVYDGQSGSLDHAIASPGLTEQISGVAVWHINADEPSALDYNDYNQPALYQPGAYRASDHDPVVIAFTPGVRYRMSLPLINR